MPHERGRENDTRKSEEDQPAEAEHQLFTVCNLRPYFSGATAAADRATNQSHWPHIARQ